MKSLFSPPGNDPQGDAREATRMLLRNRREVESLLDLGRLIDALARAMAELSAGGISIFNP